VIAVVDGDQIVDNAFFVLALSALDANKRVSIVHSRPKFDNLAGSADIFDLVSASLPLRNVST
jgi:hypothetical protein